MKVSLNTVKKYIDFELPQIDELVAKINAQLGGVEEVIDLHTKYKDAVIVKVVECEKHANADKLSVCKIDAGTGELIQVVCGANNVHADMWAVWLPPESTVPATYDDVEPFVLGARELRGEMSNGMLASARELAIGDDHDGIIDITTADVPQGKELVAGVQFAEVFGLDDTIIDIENKMFTHRPDLFGQLGVAREIAGIFGERFTSPEWYIDTPAFTSDVNNEMPLEIFNEAPDKAPRFMAVTVKDVSVAQSPLWLKCALVAMGGKPINTIVDATNYMMLLTAQPTHAYDYDKIRGGRLGVRMARGGETIPLLNGKTYELTTEDIVIADGEGAIGLAGIMGGGNSEVTAETNTIVLEVATFDMYTVRKSSMRHGLFTDALTRFNKGQSPLQNDRVLRELMKLIENVAGGAQASPVHDLMSENVERMNETRDIAPPQAIMPVFIRDRLGVNLPKHTMVELLGNVEFPLCQDCSWDPSDEADNNDELHVSAPFWRTDIHVPEDVVEELGRLYGYDRLPRELPLRSARPVAVNAKREMEQSVREILSRAGANEVLTYTFVHERVLEAAGQEMGNAYQLSNALSPDLQYYRLSLTPSLLDKTHGNSKAGHDEFALFEIGKSHDKKNGLDDEGLPIEEEKIAFVYTSKKAKAGAAFYSAKRFLSFLADQLGIQFAYEPLGSESTSPAVAAFEPKRSAIITDQKNGSYLGVVGEYKKTVQRNFKLPEYTAGFELDSEALLALVQAVSASYQPLSRYPGVERDISLRVDKNRAYAEVLASLEAAINSTGLQTSIVPLGIYQPEHTDTKNATFRLLLTSRERTLTSEEVNKIVAEMAAKLAVSIGAALV